MSEVRYPSGVIDRAQLPRAEELPPDWALQDPDDWVSVLETAIPAVLAQTPESRAPTSSGSASTSRPAPSCRSPREGVPLCTLAALALAPATPGRSSGSTTPPSRSPTDSTRSPPSAARRSWRATAASISSEWYFPKLIELWLEDREVYDEAYALHRGDRLDRVVADRHRAPADVHCRLQGDVVARARGCPTASLLRGRLPGLLEPAEKLGTEFHPLGTRAGTLRAEVAARTGLPESVAVAVGNVDSFVSVPGAGVDRPGTFVMVVGTSICDLVVDPRGDPPARDHRRRQGRDPARPVRLRGGAGGGRRHARLVRRSDRAAARAPTRRWSARRRCSGPGETGLVALDWWNGNRTILADADLSGVDRSASRCRRPREAEIYRALLESIAFGNRRIMDNFEEHGLELDEIVACGGIAEKSPLTMQLLADTSGRPVRVPASTQIPARGAALFGAVAAGAFDDIEAAIAATRPADRPHATSPTPRRAPSTSGSTRSTASSTSCSAAADAELLHGLKRIRDREESPDERRQTPDRTARDHAGALRRHAARDHRTPG